MTPYFRLALKCAVAALLAMPATVCRAEELVPVEAAAPAAVQTSATLPPATLPTAATIELTTATAQPQAASDTDETIEDLKKRLAEVESRLFERDATDEKQKSTAAKKFTVRAFGRIHIDTGFFEQDRDNRAQVGNAFNGVDIRRARLGVEGEGFDTFFYRFDVDFVTFDSATQARPTIFDAYLDTQNLPIIGNLRVGHFREPFSLERLDSTNDLPFMERSAVVNTLAPFRNLGIMAFDVNDAQSMTWSYGVFDENTNEFGEDEANRAGLAGTGRVTWLPWYDEAAQGRYLLHMGASYTVRRVNDRQRRFNQPPELVLKEGSATRTPNFIDTGVIPLEHYQVAGWEVSSVLGSLSIQGEYLALFGEQVGNRGLFLHGGYIEAMYWLTGENRNYLRKLGIYGPVTPYSNFFRVRDQKGRICSGSGAWEATARYSYFDTNDRNVNGGVLNNFTLGLNWNYAVRCRVMFNFIHAMLDRNNRDGNADIVAMRFQYAF